MKHRRLKVASTRPKREQTTIYDRQAVQLPASALIAVGVRDDPYERGGRISVALSLRGDPLLSLHARNQIADYQFAAGRRWQEYYQMAAIAPLKAQNFMLEPVDCSSSGPRTLTDLQVKAMAMLNLCHTVLGESGHRLVVSILGGNLPIQQAALARGMVTRREQEYVGQRFRESLSELARVFGYA